MKRERGRGESQREGGSLRDRVKDGERGRRRERPRERWGWVRVLHLLLSL